MGAAVCRRSAGNKVIECLAHLIALPRVTVEDRDEIEAALAHSRNGIDFADALHLAASKSCSELLTFDDRGYARRAKKTTLEAASPNTKPVTPSGLPLEASRGFLSRGAGKLSSRRRPKA